MEISFVGASIAAATMGSMTVLVAKQTMAHGKKVMEPLGDDDGLICIKGSEGGAVCWPVDVSPDRV